MIKINNLNKFYNKNKSNQIHVINDVSLSFADSGLVCLLGPSGSGKTTLLNAIGGLDKVESGSISYNSDTLTNAKSDEWDFIRNKNVGYIFQNYNLFLNLSVYDNVMFILKMTSLSNEEAHERVMYALAAVGIDKYRKRRVIQLSGGQQQRVAIARALAKSPNVIIADEPTGNLDEKNTTAIMSILKKISKHTLVILVSHEERISQFYADRIIRLSDGKIVSDEVNNSNNAYSYTDDNNIYLQELKKDTSNTDNISINYFYDKEKTDLEFNVVFKNGTLYIETKSESKIHIINETNDVKIIDGKKPVITNEVIEEVDYDLKKIDESHYKKKSNIKFIDTIKMGFKRFADLKKRNKLMLLGFVLSAILFVNAAGAFYSNIVLDESKFIRTGHNDYLINNISDENLENVFNESIDNNLGIVLQSTSLNFEYTQFSQTNFTFSITRNDASFTPKHILKSSDVVYGELSDVNGIVIDKMVADSLLESYSFKNAGINSYDKIIGIHSVNNNYYISGIIDKKTPEVYASIDILLGGKNYISSIDTKYDIKRGEIYSNNVDYFIGQKIIIESKEYTVVGFDESVNIMNHQDYLDYKYNSYFFQNLNYFYFYSYDNQETNEFFSDTFGESTYENSYSNSFLNDKKYYVMNQEFMLMIYLVIGGTLFVASLVFLYFMMRSSLISRIYDIGVYRSLGVTKRDIYKLFIAELFLISILSSTVGFIIGYLTVSSSSNLSGIRLPIQYGLLVLVTIIISNVFIGLLPVRKLLKLTPSEIGSKYDI
ncbi:MAG: ABC transporter ATP-binding protein/permease [bacterium]